MNKHLTIKILLILFFLNFLWKFSYGQNETNDTIKEFKEIDSTSFYNSHGVYISTKRASGDNCYFKIGDDIKWSRDTNAANWSNGIYNRIINCSVLKTYI